MSGFGYLNRCLFENGYKPTFGDVIRFIQPQSGFIYDKVIPPPARYVTFKSDVPFTLSWDADCRFTASNDEWQTAVTNGSISSSVEVEGYYYIYLVGQTSSVINSSSKLHIYPISEEDDIHVSVSGQLSALGGDVKENRLIHRFSAPSLFAGCTEITDVSGLIISSTIYCNSMFSWCTSLTNTPTIVYEYLESYPLESYHFSQMFEYCYSLQDASGLEFPDIQLSTRCYYNMFAGSHIIIPPTLQSTKLASYCYAGMFQASQVKVSAVSTEEYTEPFRIPSSGTASSTGNDMTSNMLFNTAGTFKGDPQLEQTYYLDIRIPEPEE